MSINPTYPHTKVPLMPTLVEDYIKNPVGFLGTVFTDHWIYGGRFALIGDSAHALTPFFGQVQKRKEKDLVTCCFKLNKSNIILLCRNLCQYPFYL